MRCIVEGLFSEINCLLEALVCILIGINYRNNKENISIRVSRMVLTDYEPYSCFDSDRKPRFSMQRTWIVRGQLLFYGDVTRHAQECRTLSLSTFACQIVSSDYLLLLLLLHFLFNIGSSTNVDSNSRPNNKCEKQ